MHDIETGFYLAKIKQIVVFADGEGWFLFELTISLKVEGQTHSIKYLQPSWKIKDIYADFFGTTATNFNDWYQLRYQEVIIFLQESEDPQIIEIVSNNYLEKYLIGGEKMSNNLTLDSLDQYPEILNPKILAEYLGIAYSKSLCLVRSGAIPCVKVGRHYKIPKSGLIQWLNQPGYREYL